jgi:aminoglycoside 6'-N-acetyltransferase
MTRQTAAAVSMTIRNRVKLRPATPDDLELLRHWDRQPHIIAGKGDEDWHWQTELARNPDWREQLIAEAAGRPIGFLPIIDPARDESNYWSCCKPGQRAIDIWIGEEDALGRGHGTEMMKQAIACCFADPTVEAILVDPLDDNTRAHRFYERLGFEYVARRRFGDDSCFVYRLRRPGPGTATAD